MDVARIVADCGGGSGGSRRVESGGGAAGKQTCAKRRRELMALSGAGEKAELLLREMHCVHERDRMPIGQSADKPKKRSLSF